MPVWNDTPGGSPRLGEQLQSDQKIQLNRLLEDFSNIFTTNPRQTQLIEHKIETGDACPIRLQPYRLPHAFRDIVAKELKEMEAGGIIKPSSSEWAAPIVLVKKKTAP